MELKDATVLIVDDERTLLDILSEWLEEESCRVLTAGDGVAASRILRHQHLDVIVSDVRMPVMDGILLLKNLSMFSNIFNDPTGNHPPKMIFITGFTDLKPREAYNLGVEAILQKPIERTEFVGTVQRSLRSHEETWSERLIPGGMPLHVALPRVSVAIEQGRIAFGRGGFCLYCSFPVREGPVRFDLEFEGEKVSFAGQGLIRWAEPDEQLLGVEILALDEPCRDWAFGLIAGNARSSYIPRAPFSATPRSKAAK
jgi:CheY-like chemotaxis protein